MELNLKDKLILVTGSSLGIGKGIVCGFLKEHARVIVTGRDDKILAKTGLELSEEFGKDKVMTFAGDLSQAPALDDLFNKVSIEFGVLNALICNIGSGRSVPPLEEDHTEWQRMLQINLLTATSCVRTFLPLLEKAANPDSKDTSITFVSSICGEEALGCPVAYSAAKSALNSYAKNISRPLGKRGIRVNVVSPGNIIFPGSTWENKLAENQQAVHTMLKREVPIGRLGTVDEIADVIVFLSSERSSFLTGADIIVDGGQTRVI